MAHEMDLFRSTREDIPDVRKQKLEPFGIHGLAAIQVHDLPEVQERKVTLPEICAVDAVLSKEEYISARYLLCAFGRNAVPVLHRLLTKECGMSEEQMNAEVQKVASQLLRSFPR